MTRARRREIRGEVTIDTVAQPDEDAGGEARLRLRDGAIEAGSGRPPQPVQRGRERTLRGQQLQTLDAERSDRADAREVRAIGVLGGRPDSPP